MKLAKYKKITLNLQPYSRELYREKILEAWIMENVTYNGNNMQKHNELVDALGAASHFANSIFTYYTNFLDVLLYNEASDSVEEFCPHCRKYSSRNKVDIRVIELKKGRADCNALRQSKEYQDWAIKTLADGDTSKVKAIIIANTFSSDAEAQTEIECVKYLLTDSSPYVRLSHITHPT